MAHKHDLRPTLFGLVLGARECRNKKTEQIAREQLERCYGIKLTFHKASQQEEVQHA